MSDQINLESIKLIVGLGNPGPKFSNTRHNVGAMAVTRLKTEDTLPQKLLVPDSFMNESGPAVARVANKNGIRPEEILVIHDDIDLEPGEWKYKDGGGAGGHNGIRSLITALGTDTFKRIRIGVGRPFPHKPTNVAEEAAVANFVLSPIPTEDKQNIDRAIEELISELLK